MFTSSKDLPGIELSRGAIKGDTSFGWEDLMDKLEKVESVTTNVAHYIVRFSKAGRERDYQQRYSTTNALRFRSSA